MGAMKRRTLLGLLLLVGAAACYLAIVVARQGPPPGGDTTPLTDVTSALASGQLHVAAADDGLPNPPGYPLLSAPLVAAFSSLVGSPTWCLTSGRAADLPKGSEARDPNLAAVMNECGNVDQSGVATNSLPPWYRAQGLLGVLGWLVLAAGAWSLLRAAEADSPARTAALFVFLAFLPAGASAIVQFFHPQDIVSLGLALAAMGQTIRRRWVLAGALFGLAVLTKQFALLLVLPAVLVAPDARSRLRLGVTSVAVAAAGLLPFLVSAPRATLENFSGFSAGGAVSGATVLTLSGVTGSVASAVARDAPVLFATAVCLWAFSRRGPWLRRPVALVALGLACVSGRLVFESVVFPYYLLAPSVLFFLLDLVARRSPYRSLGWCAGAAFFVAVRPGNHAVDAFGTLVFALLAVGAGILEVLRLSSAAPEADRRHPVTPGVA
jgi:Glycosyltransferase family 87